MAKYDFALSENIDEATDENLIDAFELIRDETIFAEKFGILRSSLPWRGFKRRMCTLSL